MNGYIERFEILLTVVVVAIVLMPILFMKLISVVYTGRYLYDCIFGKGIEI